MIADPEREIRHRLSQTGRIATALGVHRNTVMNWRTGRTEPGFTEGVRLALVIDVPPGLLSTYLCGKRGKR